ncbi:2-desacetyl-2-hydroxyethyl bacteriochlorophyllide A dehydrogenase [Panacagrimonas perspica]|uniref:2-desacetyl-2-hydroxyethyl bacteriochlorophyllide A dehydrogenase n=1 Tax=Panacagrimonas perspica TaxID=381431 RepID=A0A4S3K8W5_9GAMM|nr:zinc-binding dehydrogenase [Panacagrimonas perspica]TDU31902.1 2-desacetyl-2-hydroxyethyl bacteriochlorophyllide A dehydrogenase [Panacagrimonas perspica]THD04224.1 iditol 2-dehydrogenase [Panacagrimonas perspica]
MKGIVFEGDRKVAIESFDDPTPGPGEVVLEIRASGMCGSDLKFYRAPPGQAMKALGFSSDKRVIAGHEPCGVVVAVGSHVNPKQARVGQRVMVHHYKGCGACPHCSTGWQQLCVEGVAEVYGVTGHGAHARYMKCPANTCVNLPESLSFETGAAISCGTGTAWGAIQRLELKGDQTLVIFGQGPVGLSTTQLAAALGARVIALDVSPARLARAKSFGAHELIDPSKVDAVAAIRELTGGLGAHASLDASSSPDARRQAVQCLRTWGKACFVGEGGQLTLDVSPDLLRRQITVIGHWTFSTVGQAECAKFIADRNIDVDSLFTERWTLDQADEAYKLFDGASSGKGVFVFH